MVGNFEGPVACPGFGWGGGGCGLYAVGIDDIMLLSRVGHFENDAKKP